MRISELVHQLNELADRQGDLEVVVNYDVEEPLLHYIRDKVYTPERVGTFSPRRDDNTVSEVTYALIE